MITEDQIDEIKGRAMLSAEQTPLGSIQSVFRDIDNDEPVFAVLQTGDRLVLVPLVNADFTGETVVVPYPTGLVNEAPTFDGADDLTADVEQDVYSHYEVAVVPVPDS